MPSLYLNLTSVDGIVKPPLVRHGASETPFLLAPPPAKQEPPRNKKNAFALGFAILILIGGFVGGSFLLRSKSIFLNKTSLLSKVKNLLIAGGKALPGEQNGRVNLLLLGIPGAGSDGPLLSDTIILASIFTNKKEALLVSIPRDLSVEIPGFGFRKINSAYALGEGRNRDTGANTILKVVEKISGQVTPFIAIMDFNGFKKAVDVVGGIDVNIERSFTDAQFPDGKGGYLPTVEFTQGVEHMNGERALIFARSRHGTNNEGSDFARSVRQQKILQAFRKRVEKLKITFDLTTITRLISTFADQFRTNLEPHEIRRLAELAKDIPEENVFTIAFDPSSQLICPRQGEDSAYILTHCPGIKDKDIRFFFEHGTLIAKARREQATVTIVAPKQDASINKMRELISSAGMKVKLHVDASRSGERHTRIVVNNPNRIASAEYLKVLLGVEVNIEATGSTDSDFSVFLGEDALARFASKEKSQGI